MYGAIIGDIVGSVYEFRSIKTKNFDLFTKHSTFTDDTVMTVAVASAILKSGQEGADINAALVTEMQRFGKAYPYAGYGTMFSTWLYDTDPKPYGSFGNGSAMRVSPCGLIACSLSEALELARLSAEVTHDHPEGIKGAQATAAAIFLARAGWSKDKISGYICDNFYNLSNTLDEIRPSYRFDASCQGSVPQAITAFLESTDYEDAIRNAVSLGGDSDTIGAITGSIAWAYYGRTGIMPDMQAMLDAIRLPDDMRDVIDRFEQYKNSCCNEMQLPEL